MKNKLYWIVWRDCFKSYFVPVILYTLSVLVGELVLIYSASIIGIFTNFVMQGNFQYGIENLSKIIACIGISIIVPILLSTAGEISMFASSLNYGHVIIKRFLGKTYESVCNINEGEVQYRLEDDSIELGNIWTNMWIKGISLPVIIAYLLFSSLPISPWFTCIIFIISLLKMILPVAVKKKMTKLDLEEREWNTKIRMMESNILRNPCEIKLYGVQSMMIERLKRILKNYREGNFSRKIKTGIWMQQLMNGVNSICVLIILLIGAIAVSAGNLSVGEITMMIGYFYVFDTIMEYIYYFVQNYPIYKNLLKRISFFYKEHEDKSGILIENATNIVINDLEFAYNDKKVFAHVSKEIPMNAKIAIKGANGSGKSTLLKILCGFYHSYLGNIWINQSNLKNIAIDSWRSQCAYVEQFPYLFQGTIRENVRLGNLNATEGEVNKVMEQVGILELSEKVIGKNQMDLSGGEHKKVAIARALLRKCNVLFMDEPGNDLDEKSIIWLKHFINNFPNMILYITHDKDMEEQAGGMINL